LRGFLLISRKNADFAGKLGPIACELSFHSVKDAALLIPMVLTRSVGMAAAATGKAPSKGEVLSTAAEAAGLNRKQVAAVFDSLGEQIKNALGKRGPGTFTVPGLMRIKVKNVPARKARMGIDPFTKQEKMFKAKPASKKVRVVPLKALKEMVK